MHVAYFDEVKAMPKNGQNSYLVGGLAVPMEQIGPMEEAVKNLAVEFFGTGDLTTKTEFHASHLFFGKSHFKGVDPNKRNDLLVRLAGVISAADGVKRVYAAIDQTKLYNPAHAAKFAFAHFIERLELAIPARANCIVIGDLDDETAKEMVRDFTDFRQNGTPWVYGRPVEKVVDSVHFCRSHHSRLLQLADVYMFLVSGAYGKRTGWQVTKLGEALKEAQVELYAHRYKDWPR